MFYKTAFTTIIFSLVASQSFLSRLETEVDDYCNADTKIKVQMVFVFDRTNTFFNQKGNFSKLTQNIITTLSNKYVGSEFGIAVFADYDYAAGLTDIQTNGREEDDLTGPGDCYTLQQKLTTDADLIASQFKAITKRTGSNGSNWAESGLTAVTFAAVDRNMGWESNYRDNKGNIVRKVIVLATDATSTRVLKNTTGRHEVKGDGTDTCENTIPPTNEIVGKILRDNMITVVGIYFTTNDIYNYKVSILDYYNGIFGQMDIPYTQYSIHFHDTSNVVWKVLEGTERAVTCDEEDPPAYNTLGL